MGKAAGSDLRARMRASRPPARRPPAPTTVCPLVVWRNLFSHIKLTFTNFGVQNGSKKVEIFSILGSTMTKHGPTIVEKWQACGAGRVGGVGRAGGTHARASLSLLLSPHSLYISHTQNRYPALRGEYGQICHSP